MADIMFNNKRHKTHNMTQTRKTQLNTRRRRHSGPDMPCPNLEKTRRDENLVDDLPSATHITIPFQAYVPSAGGQKEGSWRGEAGGKVTDIA